MKVSERQGFHTLWPEAIIVCPQGLPTKTHRDPEGSKACRHPGTQKYPSEAPGLIVTFLKEHAKK